MAWSNYDQLQLLKVVHAEFGYGYKELRELKE